MTSWKWLRSAFIAVIALVTSSAFWAAPADADNLDLDLRGKWTLQWRYAAPGADEAPVAGFELRLSESPPGSDIEAWWSAAEPQTDLPLPHGPGASHVWKREGLDSGVTVFAAVRTVDSEGHCSPLEASGVVSWTPPPEPFLKDVRPTEIGSCARQAFTLAGLGLENATGVIVYSGGKTYSAQKIRKGTGSLHAIVNLPTLEPGPVDIEVVTPGGSDILEGWIWVHETTTLNGNGGGSLTAETSSEPLQVWRDGSGWRIQLAEPALSPTSTTAQEGCGNVGGSGAGDLEPLAEPVTLSGNGAPRMRVFDVSGRKIADLHPWRSGESWEARWDGTTGDGRRVASGIFFLRAETTSHAWNRKVFIVR